MNRLGVALTPVVLHSDEAGGPLDLDAPPAVVCATGPLAVATYPRTARAGAVLSAKLASTAVGIKILQSTDNGVSWTPVHALPASAGGQGWVNVSVWKGDLPLAAATNYRYGLRIERASGTGDLTAWNCQVNVVATSRTGSVAPF